MKLGRLALGVVFLGSGAMHFLIPKPFLSIVPDYLPNHSAIVRLSGLAELAGGLGVLFPATRRPAAWGLAALLVAVFPANLWMAQHPERFGSIPPWVLWARLPLQIPLVAWAWLYTRPNSKFKRGAAISESSGGARL